MAEPGACRQVAANFDFETAVIGQATRKTYPEVRFVALGFLAARLHVMAPALQKTLGMHPHGTQKAATKVSTAVRLSPEVVQAFRADGEGWQTRIDAALKDGLRTHSPV